MLSNIQKARLAKINKELEKHGCLPMTEGLSASQIADLKEAIKESHKAIMESSEFNSYHNNPDYMVSLLMQEAIEILVNPADDSPIVRYVAESRKGDLEVMTEQFNKFVEKHGEDHAKVPLLKAKLDEARRIVAESEISNRIKLALNESAGQAQTIMAAKGLHEQVLELQSKVGELQNKFADSLIAMVNDEYGSSTATEVQDRLMNALDTLMASIRTTKTELQGIVNTLSGNGDTPSASDSMSEPETIDEPAMDDLGSSSEESGSEESVSDLDLDLDLGSDDFVRKD